MTVWVWVTSVSDQQAWDMVQFVSGSSAFCRDVGWFDEGYDEKHATLCSLTPDPHTGLEQSLADPSEVATAIHDDFEWATVALLVFEAASRDLVVNGQPQLPPERAETVWSFAGAFASG